MPTIVVSGHQVTVDDTFLKLSPQEQRATIAEIASVIAANASPAQSAQVSVADKVGGVLHLFGQPNFYIEMLVIAILFIGVARVRLSRAAIDETSVRVRFGVFLGWLFNAVALALVALAAVIAFDAQGALSQGQTLAVSVLLILGGAVWLLGRGLRYVLVGPKVVALASVSPMAPQDSWEGGRERH